MASMSGSAANSKTSGPPKSGARRGAETQSAATAAFIAAIEPVVVDEPVFFKFDGSVSRKHLKLFCAWVARDVVPGIEMKYDGLLEVGNTEHAAAEICLIDVLAGVKKQLAEAFIDPDANRRLTVQMGGEEVRERLETILLALRSRALIEKARNFGKAAIGLSDDVALGAALQSLPLKDPSLTSLLMHVIVEQTASPHRLVVAASVVAGKATEEALRGAGLSPLGDAILAHAQDQLSVLEPALVGMGDIDRACRSLDRYHRLIRAVSGYLETSRLSRWTKIIAELTKQVSLRLEPRLREVSGNIAQSMRRHRDGHDRADTEGLLAALNGMYLLSAVREARESLALNALFEQVWNETGQSIEILVKRNLEEFRVDPGNEAVAKRLDTGIKMAEIRFSAEYADVFRRARDTFSKRIAS
jgi:hypothetical protein